MSKHTKIVVMALALGLGAGLVMAQTLPVGAHEVATTAVATVGEAVHAGAEATGAAAEHAVAGAHGQRDLVSQFIDVGTAVVTAVVFLTVLLVLRFTAWKPIGAALKHREDSIRDSLAAAQAAREQAQATGKELEAKIAEAQKVAGEEIRRVREDAQRLADNIRKTAEAEANALRDRTVKEIDAARVQAISDVNAHAADLALSIARKILQRQVTAEDHQKLVQESLAELAKRN
ncbi:MAG: F0F1 ATP synthase subunit B [Phycisphaerae bacterium]